MQLLRHIIAWLFDALPDVSNLLLAVLGVLMSFPRKAEEIENRPAISRTLAAFCIVLGIGGFVVGRNQRHQLESQISQLVSVSASEANKDDLKTLQTHMDAGFDRVANAIAELAKHRMVTETKPKPQLPPPTVEHTRFTERRVPSPNPAFPYGLQVIIQSDLTIQPVAFALECTGEVDSVASFVAGQNVYFSVYNGVPDPNRKNIAVVRFTFPPLNPESPLVITLLSKQDIRVAKIYKLQR